MIELIKCPVCKGEDWHGLDEYRNQSVWYENDRREEDEPVGFKLCKTCGFVTYDYEDEDSLKRAYEQDRKVMSSANIVTCNRKNMYHREFLEGELPQNLENVLDVGMAQGSFLNFMDEEGIGVENLYGTEWSEGFAKWGENEYGINVSKEIDEDITYDFISYYHVLEHMQNPDEELEKAHRVLADDGLLYISVPEFKDWVDEPSGTPVTDFEIMYHINHINWFTRQSLKNILANAGFEIIKDGDIYGYTVLCKKTVKPEAMVEEDWEKHLDIIQRQHKAIGLFKEKKYEEAIEVVPNFPDCYVWLSADQKNHKEYSVAKSFLDRGFKNCGDDSTKVLFQYAVLHFQWDENTPEKQYYSNNIKKSEKAFKRLLELRPNEDLYFFLGMIEGKYKRNIEIGVDLLREVSNINPQRWAEVENIVANFWLNKAD